MTIYFSEFMPTVLYLRVVGNFFRPSFMDTLLTFLQKKYIKQLDCNLRFLLDKYSIEEIVREIMVWLKVDNLNYFDTTTFARDFYIGSDLTQEEKDNFYNELQRQGFFQQLNNFLYSNVFAVCSWTIYTIGKFSHNDNASLLETAYETNFRLTNPILSYRCLNELSWLSSNKVDQFLEELKLDNSVKSKLILLYYYESDSDNRKFKELLTDKELISFIIPNERMIDKEEEISNRLFAFENYITEIYNTETQIDRQNFENLAKSFFNAFVLDNSVDKEHSEFLKHLSGD